MRIYTHCVYRWNDATNQYALESAESYEHTGPVALCCGATGAQNTALNQQTQFSQQIATQAGQVFGSSSAVFNDLLNTFQPTVAAGPNQEGFSAAEKANLQSQAITQSGNAYNNAKQAAGESIAAQGGGNDPALTSGTNAGVDLSIAEKAAANTSGELSQINQADYQQGRQNYDTAVSGLEQAPNVFNPSTTADNAVTNAQAGEASTANQIASQNNSWVQSVTGALGGIAGATISGGMKNLGSGVGFFGQNSPAPSSAN